MEISSSSVLMVRYGELFLKGGNMSWFASVLTKNIKAALAKYKCKYICARTRGYVEDFDEDDLDDIIKRLTKVFGIHSLSLTYKLKTDIDAIKELSAEISPKSGTFRVTVKRNDNKIQKRSMDIAAEIGGFMLSKSEHLKVDLFKYDFELNVDIRETGYTYLFYDKIPGVGGLPYNTGGKGMLLLSGGIDSPVAAYMMAKRGVKIYAIHFYSYPYTGEMALQKVKDLIGALDEYIPDVELAIVPFAKIQEAIDKNCPHDYAITLTRRFMMRIAEKWARKRECGALITGESLGQVASQTMSSINVTNSVVTMPILRPLIGSDKEEIIATAKQIETFDISIRPFVDCCTAFLPKNPVIHPSTSTALEYEMALDVDALVDSALCGIELYKFSSSKRLGI
ncbi:MAG: tRNA 4-thiouridine(8) synthase ThiI [Christensenellaceae bacterium]|jgi:thiamine biosynthesis protein ThiI|nr:tRNA 4-thiouridine(8) synthase ThiI [Christensenellaceae bacterium]